MAQLYTNNAWSVLNGAISNSATTITLATGTGSRFPTPTGGDYFLATLIGYDGSNNENAWEIVKVTARSSDTLTVVRGQEGTTAVAWANAARIELRVTAGSFSGLVEKSAPSITGSTTVTGTGLVYQADFSNATPSLRYAFKTTTSNGSTIVGAVPNGTGTASYYQVYNASNLTNASYAYLGITGSVASINSGKLGTGVALPLVFSTDSTERFRLDPASNRFQADFSNVTHANRFAFQTSTANGITGIFALPNGTATTASFTASNTSDPTNAGYAQIVATATDARILAGALGTGTSIPLQLWTNGQAGMNLDADGTFTSVRGAIGYGTGAGGTVTQATSKATAVTLNKPSGRITMHNAALAAGASVEFSLNNGNITASDIVLTCVSGFPNYTAQTQRVASGGAVLMVTNISGGSLSEAVTVNFCVIKVATA